MSKSSLGSVAQAIESIQRSYAPTRNFTTDRLSAEKDGKPNEDCDFKTIVYTKKVGQQLYQDPLLAGPMLEQAEHDNPDPDNYYPVCELGIDALSRRIENQRQAVVGITQHMKNLTDVVNGCDQSNALISIKCNDLKARQIGLIQRLLIILRKVETLRCHGVNIQNTEIKYRQQLVKILHVMKDPFMELQELSAKLSETQVQAEQYSDTLDENDLEAVCNALQQQRQGLEQLTEILEKDMRDIGIIKSSLANKTQEVPLTSSM